MLAAPLALLAAQAAASLPHDAAPTSSEDTVWTQVSAADHADAYDIYLRRFPEGEHVDTAKAALARLAPSRPVESEAQSAACDAYADDLPIDDEASTYRKAFAADTVRTYRQALTEYPAHACAPRMRVALDELERLEALSAPVAGVGPLGFHLLPGRPLVRGIDYPVVAMRQGAEGNVTMTWTVGNDGRVKDCAVTTSSGSDVLDAAACRLATQRLRYDPARDASGNAVEGRSWTTISWRIAD
ncbi:energy transducer TonB [Sphingomicrobium aestuariivivum]|uniref:energy transducer TonB n=1 Tax=Sphingomicrobium aestuariivivum TaxID=1582356 RepID=UPI001FD68C4D|nr:energy transducer TonB [Sphingomicrobium aestuariivivum]MCJ8191655.1 energy transducer TonB [Sphingomicrobium aestuariivivum]